MAYNTDRPHQALNPRVPVTPVERFAPVPAEQRALLELWLPPNLEAIAGASVADSVELAAVDTEPDQIPQRPAWSGGP
jgi:hypothetical protein